MAGDEHGSIWIESTRDPDGQPVCLVTFDKLQYYAPVEDVRATAIDLVSAFATDLLAGGGKRYFGAKTTLTLMPAGSSKQRQALVLLNRGSQDGALTPDEARAMALAWMATAEATESDHLVSEALRATGTDEAGQEKVFGYLRQLRTAAAAGTAPGRPPG